MQVIQNLKAQKVYNKNEIFTYNHFLHHLLALPQEATSVNQNLAFPGKEIQCVHGYILFFITQTVTNYTLFSTLTFYT